MTTGKLQAWNSKYFANKSAAWDRLDQETALQRLNKEETGKLLDGISSWFWSAIEGALEDIARLASISLASQGAMSSPASKDQTDREAQAKRDDEPQPPVDDAHFSKGVREGKTVELLYNQLKRVRSLYRDNGWPAAQIRKNTERDLAIAWEWIDRISDQTHKSEFLKISEWEDGDQFIFLQIAALYRYAPHLRREPGWGTVRDWRKAYRGHLQHGTPDGRKARR